MNKKKKGDKAELESYKILESLGYIVNPAPRTMKGIFIKGRIIYISQRNDHWGLFDGEAKKDKNTLYFQVKSNASHISEPKKGIEEFYDKYCSEYETCEIWLRVKRKGFVIYKLSLVHQEGYSTEYMDDGSPFWKKRYINLKGESVEEFKITEKKKEVDKDEKKISIQQTQG